MKFTSTQHPGLIVHDLGVRFIDGEADVDGKTAAELRKLPADLGVHEADNDGQAARPRRRAE